MKTWTCTKCGSKEKPNGYRNPTVCRECKSKAAKSRKKTYDKRCVLCNLLFLAKSPQAKYCKDCRAERESAFAAKNAEYAMKKAVEKAKKEDRLVFCENCKEMKIAGFPGAAWCAECYYAFKNAKENLMRLLDDRYMTKTENGKLVLYERIEFAETPQEMIAKLKMRGLI